VREALRRLEGDGLVRRQGNGSVVVMALEDEDIDDIAVLRVEVDTLAARLAMQRATADQWEHLSLLATAIGRAAPGDAEAHHDAHQAFHRALFAIAFRPRMLAVLENHVLQHLELTQLVGPVPVARPADSERRHRQLLEALRSGDRRHAERLARAHAGLNAPVAREIARTRRRGAANGSTGDRDR
jgi:DNA-binding GntR family transcriptional regulator